MTRPRRWLDTPDEAPRGARALLDAAGAPDRATRDRVWAALQGGAAPPADGAPPPPPNDAGPGAAVGAAGAAGAALAGGAGVKKLAAVVVMLAVGVAAREELPRLRRPPAAPTSTIVSAASTSRVSAPARAVTPVTEHLAAHAATPAPSPGVLAPRPAQRPVAIVNPVERNAHAAAPLERVAVTAEPTAPQPVAAPPAPLDDGGLDAERELLRAAYERLDADPSDALARVSEHERRFPQGHLGHEREVVRVEALHRLGRDDEARARIDAFLRAWSSSTQGPRMRALRERLPPETIR